MFCQKLEISLHLAYSQAQQRGHQAMTLEHLLLALLENPDVIEVFQYCKVNLQLIRSDLYMFIENQNKQKKKTSSSRKKSKQPEAIKTAKSRESTAEFSNDAQPNEEFQSVIQRAIIQAQANGQSEVNGCNVLTAIFSQETSYAFKLLQQQGLTRIDIINFLVQKKPYMPPSNKIDHGFGKSIGMENDIETDHDFNEPQGNVEKFLINLNQKARLNKIDPLIGRTKELQRAMQVLCRRSKNNPLLIGEPGVGKTAIAEGLAKMIVENNVPKLLEYTTIYTLDLGMMLAGTKYRGDFEKRFKNVLNELASRKHCILFIDEIHTLIGAGAASGGALDAANLIKPLLTTGELKCIGATTYTEYRNLLNKDKALSRRFQKVDIKEPSEKETMQILLGLKPKLESHHKIKICGSAFESAIKLSKSLIHDRFLPDKAIDLIDEACSKQNLLPVEKKKQLVTKKDIADILTTVAQIPKQRLSGGDKTMLINLDKSLKSIIFGQDHAIDKVTSFVRLSRAGLADNNKPIGNFLFSGPTGVGKTELCIQLANQLGLKMLRLDMSEYMEKHSASQIIGAPAGYVGFENGGKLTQQVSKHPHSIILLDEIEKAHPDIFNLLLQVMDYGFMTDNLGNEIDFRHTILIMTCNVGAHDMTKNDIGFTKNDRQSDAMVAVNQRFTPEFRNRLDGIIQFNALGQSHVKKVTEKFIGELQDKLKERQVKLDVSDQAIAWLTLRGHDEKMGARPMRRTITEHVKEPLAKYLLQHQHNRPCTYRITVVKNKLSIKKYSDEKTIAGEKLLKLSA